MGKSHKYTAQGVKAQGERYFIVTLDKWCILKKLMTTRCLDNGKESGQKLGIVIWAQYISTVGPIKLLWTGIIIAQFAKRRKKIISTWDKKKLSTIKVNHTVQWGTAITVELFKKRNWCL